MEEAIGLAQERSIDAMVAKNIYLGSYWSFRSHKAELLPSLNLSSNIMNYDRSQKPLQDAITGEIRYRLNDNLYNSGTISVDQNVAMTGGTLSFSSSLDRLDQYSPSRETTFSTQPITLRYLQPLWTYNALKWDKKIEPQRFEQAKTSYIESMENVTIRAVQLFFNLILSQKQCEIAENNYSNRKIMYSIASRRFKETGTVTKRDLMQLELGMINDSLSISTQNKEYKASLMNLCSFLGFNNNTEIEAISMTDVPEIELDYDIVIEKALTNSSYITGQNIGKLEAERAIERAKGNRGVSVSLNARFGLSNNDEKLALAYSNLMNYQVVGLYIRVPIMDWGMGKGRVQMAEAQQKTTLYKLEQALDDYIQSIYLSVMDFNTQREQFRMARYASEIATQRYELTLQDFAAGTVSVTELNTAQSEKESAQMKYISEMSRYWINYFNIRKLSVYDYINNTDISAEFDRLIK